MKHRLLLLFVAFWVTTLPVAASITADGGTDKAPTTTTPAATAAASATTTTPTTTPASTVTTTTPANAPGTTTGPATPTTTTTPAKPGDAAKPAAGTTPTAPATESEIQQLRELLEAQQAEIAALKEQLSAHGGNAVSAEAVSTPAGVAAGTPSGSGAAPSGAFTPVLVRTETDDGQPAPLSIKIGSAEFTPGGFVDMMDVYRSTNVGSGIGTTFTSIPYNNSSTGQGGLSENRVSAANSRLSLKVTAPAAGGNLLGYVETDFNGNQPTNLYATRNSNTLRMRLYFADYTHGKWEVLGGQDWSLLTPDRKGIDPLPRDIFTSLLLDANNSIGEVTARQTQLRAVYHPSDSWALGFSVENPDPWTGTAVTFPACFAGTGTTCTSSQTNQVDTGAATSSPASWPDFVAKIAHDQNVGGKNWHFEAAGLLTTNKLYTPTSVSGLPATTDSRTGGGVTANFDLQLTQGFHLIANSFWSDGGGRYLYITGPNLVVEQNPTNLSFVPSLEHAGAGLAGFEWQLTHKLQWFSYYGGNYFSKNYSIDPTTGKDVGYGYPGSSNSQNREFQEISTGFIQTFWQNENYGALQIINQTSYVTRSPWVAGTGPANAHTAMVYMDLRYVLP
jgi:hypothetical protein